MFYFFGMHPKKKHLEHLGQVCKRMLPMVQWIPRARSDRRSTKKTFGTTFACKVCTRILRRYRCVDVVCLQIHSRVKKLRAKKIPSEVVVLDAQPSLPVGVSGNVDVYLTKRPDVKRGSWLEVVEQITGDLWLPIKTC